MCRGWIEKHCKPQTKSQAIQSEHGCQVRSHRRKVFTNAADI